MVTINYINIRDNWNYNPLLFLSLRIIRLLTYFVVLKTFHQIWLLAFFGCFMSSSRANTEPWPEPFIQPKGLGSSNSVNHERVQMLSSSNYSQLILPLAEIGPATTWWFPSEALSKQSRHPLHYAFLPNRFVIG